MSLGFHEVSVGVVLPVRAAGSLGPPEALPIGRAALLLRGEGVVTVFGDRVRSGAMDGWIAEPGRWRAVQGHSIAAAYDRFPSRKRAAEHAVIRAGLGGRPLGNAMPLTLLCRDKLGCQRHLEAHGIACPPVEGAPARFEASLAAWGEAFLKPRFGALGEQVRRVAPGDPLGLDEPAVLQRAVRPPGGWAGVSVRVLVQRLPSGRWVTNPPVARRSVHDPVVNVARGARAVPAVDVLSAATLDAVDERAVAIATALADHPAGDLLVEVGPDFAIDAAGAPWPIEVNSRPRGRLRALAEAFPDRFGDAHVEACARPIRYLAAWVRGRAGGG